MIGGFYSHARQNSYQRTVDPFYASLVAAITPIITGGTVLSVEQFTGSPMLPGNVTYLNTNDGRDRQIAGFAQVDWRALDRLTLTAGVRVSHAVYDFSTFQAGPGAGTSSLVYSGRQAETPVTPKLGIEYRITPDTMVYASAAKGFRTGGANAPVNATQCAANLNALGLERAPAEYQSDTVWSYEGGAKGKAIDGTLQYQASAYYIKWQNIQQFVYLPLCGGGFVNNNGSASSRGFDLAVQVRLSPDWTFGLTTGYVDARYDRTVTSGLGVNYVTRGDKLTGSPWSINLSLGGQFDVGARRFYTRLDYDHQARYSRADVTQNPANVGYDPGATPSAETNDLSFRLGTRVDGLDLSLFVNNALNQKPNLSRAHYSAADPVFTYVTVRPRTAGLTGIYRF
ncbi:MAG: TonB-dependent receptor [Sphingomonas adhaesiva]